MTEGTPLGSHSLPVGKLGEGTVTVRAGGDAAGAQLGRPLLARGEVSIKLYAIGAEVRRPSQDQARRSATHKLPAKLTSDLQGSPAV